MYIPFEQLTQASLREELKESRRFFVVQRFRWPGVEQGKGFMATPYPDVDTAREHASRLDAKEGKMLDAHADLSKLESLLAKGSGYRVFLNRIKERNWNDRMLRLYRTQIVRFLSGRTPFRRSDAIDILFTMKHGRVMASITNGERQMEVAAYELIR